MRSALKEFFICLILTFHLFNSEAPASQHAIAAYPDSIAQHEDHQRNDAATLRHVHSDSLMRLMEFQQGELVALEQKLQQNSVELVAREREFHTLESEIKSFHNGASLLFFAGSILLIGGLIYWVMKNWSHLKTKFALTKNNGSSLR